MSHTEVRIKVQGGRLVMVYDDAHVALIEKGDAHVKRASHVEPAIGGGWFADMTPSGGGVLYANGEHVARVSTFYPVPFATRAAALEAERVWLRAHIGI